MRKLLLSEVAWQNSQLITVCAASLERNKIYKEKLRIFKLIPFYGSFMGIITVLTPDERVKWTQSLSKTEVDQVKEYCKTFPETRNLLDALVIPIRTNQNFANDLLLPTFYQAIKVEHTIGRFIAILISLFLDVITLPIRFITAIPRAATNAARKEHPLLELLRKKE